MPDFTTLLSLRGADRAAVSGLALALANALLPPGVTDAVTPLWDWACVALRQLRGTVLPA